MSGSLLMVRNASRLSMRDQEAAPQPTPANPVLHQARMHPKPWTLFLGPRPYAQPSTRCSGLIYSHFYLSPRPSLHHCSPLALAATRRLSRATSGTTSFTHPTPPSRPQPLGPAESSRWTLHLPHTHSPSAEPRPVSHMCCVHGAWGSPVSGLAPQGQGRGEESTAWHYQLTCFHSVTSPVPTVEAPGIH